VFVVLTGEMVDAAEEGAADTAGIAVVVRGVGEADLGVTDFIRNRAMRYFQAAQRRISTSTPL